MTSRRLAAVLLFSSLVLGSGTARAVPCPTTGCLTIRLLNDSGTLNMDTNITRNLGEMVSLEFAIDTNGLTFEGYGHDVSFSPTGRVSDIVFSHRMVTDGTKTLTPNAVGPFICSVTPATTTCPGMGPDGVTNVNQLLLTSGAGLNPGTYVVDTMSFVLTQIGTVDVTAAFGGVLNAYGLGGGSTNNITFFDTNVNVVPEPGTGLLLATGLLGLAACGRRPRRA